jgi:hypothetical protein
MAMAILLALNVGLFTIRDPTQQEQRDGTLKAPRNLTACAPACMIRLFLLPSESSNLRRATDAIR